MEVQLLTPGVAEAGSTTTLQCSVTLIPYLVVLPIVTLYGPREQLLASGKTDHLLNYTFNSVRTWDVGLYVCRTELIIEYYDVYSRTVIRVTSEAPVHGLSVLCKYLCYIPVHIHIHTPCSAPARSGHQVQHSRRTPLHLRLISQSIL